MTDIQTDQKIAFGIGQLNNPTPTIITWIFRTEFIMNKVFLFWLSSTHLLGNMRWDIQEVLLIVTAIDMATWLAARFFGIKKTDMEDFNLTKKPDQ